MVLNIFGGTQPHEFHECIDLTLRCWKIKCVVFFKFKFFFKFFDVTPSRTSENALSPFFQSRIYLFLSLRRLCPLHKRKLSPLHDTPVFICVTITKILLLEPGEKYLVCMASILSSSGRNSAYFDNIRLELSNNAYAEVHFHPLLSKYEKSINRFI